MDFTKPWHERAYLYRREAGAPKKNPKRPKRKSRQPQVPQDRPRVHSAAQKRRRTQ